MNTYNHIIINIQDLDNTKILRIIPIENSNDYISELRDVYNIDDDIQLFKCIYNSAQWYDRLMDDFKYKKFKNTTISEIKRGLWTITSDDIDNFFNNQLYPYIMVKLQGYYEDDDIEESYLGQMRAFKSLNDIDVSKYVEIKMCKSGDRMKYKLKNPEILDSNFYILKPYEIYALLLSIGNDMYIIKEQFTKSENIDNNTDNIVNKHKNTIKDSSDNLDNSEFSDEDNDDTKKSNIIIKRSNDFWGIETNSSVFTANQIYKHFITLNIEKSDYFKFITESKYKEYIEKNCKSYQSILSYEGWNMCNHTYAPFDNNDMNTDYYTIGAPIDSIGKLFLSDFINSNNTPEYIDWSRKYHEWISNGSKRNSDINEYINSYIERKEVEQKKEDTKDIVYVYYNIISKINYCYDKSIKYIPEIKLINEVKFNSSIGKSLLDIIQNNLNSYSVMKDVEILLSLFSNRKNINSSDTINNSSKNNDIKGVMDSLNDSVDDIQKHYTQKYVEQYKNDNSETLASRVIETVFFYLSNYIEAKNINMNKIGQDLVELGVKKMRKTRGNVYAIDNPTKEDIIVNIAGDEGTDVKVKKDKKNYQIRIEPDLNIEKQKLGPWNISSKLEI